MGGQALPYCASELLASDQLSPEQLSLDFEGHLPLRYVVKRHRVEKRGQVWHHTDWRLEARGVLLSWASDEHVNLDPARPIALREMPDHQMRYIDGERSIPEGDYGAGPMVVWDYGWYRPLASGVFAPGEGVVEALRRGRLNFWMQGVRLRGAFRIDLVPTGWQLGKLADSHATTMPVAWDDLSVLTGRSLDEVAADHELRRKPSFPSPNPLFEL